MSELNYYDLLSLDKNATKKEIKKAYKKKVLIHHPDKKTGDKETFSKIKTAYDILIDPEKRKLFDEFGVHGNDADYSQLFNNILQKVYVVDDEDHVLNPLNRVDNIIKSINETILSFTDKIKKTKDIISKLESSKKKDKFQNSLNRLIDICRENSLQVFHLEQNKSICHIVKDEIEAIQRVLGRFPQQKDFPSGVLYSSTTGVGF